MQALFSRRLRFRRDDGSAFPEWTPAVIEDLALINPPSTLPKRFRYIDLESVTNGQIGILREHEALAAPSRAQRVPVSGDVLFQAVRPYQRNHLFFDRAGDIVASTGFIQLRAHANARFLYSVLMRSDINAEVMRRCTGTGYPAISASDLADIPIDLPHPDEQRKIADALTALDGRIAAGTARLDALKEWRRGLLQKLFVR